MISVLIMVGLIALVLITAPIWLTWADSYINWVIRKSEEIERKRGEKR